MTDTWTNLNRLRTVGATPAAAAAPTTRAHPPDCPCPVCGGLRTFERPRFFAGQLLTEAELTSLQTYMIDKHRLHNVHLHGWGVVCGLQVRCDDCGDGLVLEPGYAIDPCGNDIVVPDSQRVDVLRMIQQCVQQTAPACDPPRYQVPEACDDSETWCLTVKYREWNTRAVTPLATGRTGSGCSCGGSTRRTGGGSCRCGGVASSRPGWECTCGTGGSADASVCSCGGGGGPVASTNAAPTCEPSRTRELYELGVCRSDGTCHDLRARLAGTFPLEAAECVAKLRPILRRHVSSRATRSMGKLVLNEFVADDNFGAQETAAHEAICGLYDAVLEIYRTDPMRTACTLPSELAEIDCSERGPNESVEAYRRRLQTAATALVLLLVAYVRDCICYHLMPPCPPPPCDDRVILACFTVREGRVVSICNFDCRRHAGSFVSRNYWLPIGPIVSWVIGTLCCFPLIGGPRPRGVGLGDRVRGFMAQQRTSALRRAIAKDDFAVVGHWVRQGRELRRALTLDSLLNRADTAARPAAESINLAAYVNMPPESALDALRANGVTVTATRTLAAGERVPSRPVLFPSAAAGERLVAFERGGRIVGFGRDTSAPSPRPTRRRDR